MKTPPSPLFSATKRRRIRPKRRFGDRSAAPFGGEVKRGKAQKLYLSYSPPLFLKRGSGGVRKAAAVFLGSFFIIAFGFAESPLTLEARAMSRRVTLGDEIKLYVRAVHAPDVSVKPLKADLNLAPFELKGARVFSESKKGAHEEKVFLLTLAVFQLGDVLIPPVPVHYVDASGHPGLELTEPVPIKVVSVGKKKGDKDDIRPIKGPLPSDLSLLRSIVCGILALALSIFLAVNIVRHRRQKQVDLESLKPPHERAMLELGRLRKKEYLESGKLKEYYSELADILRRYLERRFEMEALELTTTELIARLKKKEFDPIVADRIRRVLENADLVKFAKFVPDAALGPGLEREVAAIVDATTPPPVSSARGGPIASQSRETGGGTKPAEQKPEEKTGKAK